MATDLIQSSHGSCCGDDCCYKFELTGCAAGVPYIQVAVIGVGATPVLRWINLDTGDIVDVKPTGFKVGECDIIAEKICYKFGTDAYTVYQVNGVTTIFKNDVLLTLQADIDAALAVFQTATYENVVCCPDCTVNNKICYEFGTDRYIVYTVNGVTTIYKNGVLLTVTADITAAQTLINTATEANLVDCVQDLLDSKVCYEIGADRYSVITVNGVVTYAKNDVVLTAPADITAAQTAVAGATYVNVVDCTLATNSQICYKIGTDTYSTVTVNDATTYYKNGTALTAPADITAAETAIAGATAANVVDCNNVPAFRQCYSFCQPSTYTGIAASISAGTPAAPANRSITSVGVVDATTNLTVATLTLSPAVPYVINGVMQPIGDIAAALQAQGYEEFFKTNIPGVTEFTYNVDSGSLSLGMYDPTPPATLPNFKFGVGINGGGLISNGFGAQTLIDFCGGTRIPVTVLYEHNVATFYENGVAVTDATRNTTLKSLMAAASLTDMVCCPDCNPGTPPPDGNICYQIPVTETTTKNYVDQLVYNQIITNNDKTVPLYITDIYFGSGFPPTIPKLTLPTVVNYWNGSAYINEAVFKQALIQANFLAFIQTYEPLINTYTLDYLPGGGGVLIRLWDEQNVWTGTSRSLWVGASLNPDGSSPTEFFTSTPVIDSWSTSTTVSQTYYITTKTLNGVTTYYEDGVVVTDATRIAEIEALIADQNNPAVVVSCAGDSVTCQAFFDTETFIATAGQTSFTMAQPPSGDVRFSRNGAALADDAATVTGSTVTYVPASNNNTALLAGDRIEISYVYNVCTGGATPTIVDGSETKVTAGTGVTVTGTGTTADPYVVNATPTIVDGSETKVTAGTGVTVTGTGTTANPYVVNASGATASFASMVKTNQSPAPAAGALVTWGPTSQTYGTNVIANPATETFLLKAGFVYEIDVQLQAEFTNIEGYFNYGIYQGTTATSLPTQIGTPGKVYGQNATFGGGGKYSVDAHAYVVATVDTYVGVKSNARSSVSSLSAYEGASWFAAKVIGTI